MSDILAAPAFVLSLLGLSIVFLSSLGPIKRKSPMTWTPIHKHMLYKIDVISPELSPLMATAFLRDVVEQLGMNPVTEPQAVYVPDEGNEGLTGSINLSTSHVAFHVWDKTNIMMLDVYSCKDFDSNTPLDVVHEYFGIDNVLYSMEIDRDTGLVKESN